MTVRPARDVRGIALLAMILAWVLPAQVVGQSGGAAPTATPAATGSDRPFEILDNSFLVEEAFNQPYRIFQNIVVFEVDDGEGRALQFAQEWPIGGPRHQLSYAALWALGDGEERFEQFDVNYRFQLLTEAPGTPAFSPRVTLSVRNRSSHRVGGAINLPVSKQFGNSYVHANAGVEWERADLGPGITGLTASSLLTPWGSASVIYRLLPMLHLMVEGGLTSIEAPNPQGTLDEDPRTSAAIRATEQWISPGARLGFNLGSHQLVLGAAVPFTHAADEWSRALFTYLSYELPFGPTQ